MKKWIQTVTGLIMSAFLTLGLGGKALADDEEALPEPAATEVIDSQSAETSKAEEPKAEAPKAEEPMTEAPKTEEITPVEASEIEEPVSVEAPMSEAEIAAVKASVIGEERVSSPDEGLVASKPSEPSEDVQIAEIQPLEESLQAAPAAEIPTAKDAVSSARAPVTVRRASLAAASDAASGVTDSFYTIEDGSHVMVNHSGGSYSAADGKDLTILASGLNHIDSIGGTGAVKIGGSGILLVDSMDDDTLANLELMPFTDMYGEKGGSVAVFVKRPAPGGGEQYELVNGSVPGVLDEEYQIDGIKLVVPAGSTLTIGSIGAAQNADGTYTYYTGSNSGVENWDNLESAGHLIIGSGAELIVNGTVNLTDTDSRVVDGSIRPTLGIEGDGQVFVDGGTLSGGIVDINGIDDHIVLDSSSTGSVDNTVVKVTGNSAVTAPVSHGGILSRSAGDTTTLTKTVNGKTVIDTENLAANLSHFGTDTGKLVVELRRKYADGRIISHTFAPVGNPSTVPEDTTVTDSEAAGELIVWEFPDGKEPDLDLLDPSNWQIISGTSIVSTVISATGSGTLGGYNIVEVYDPNAPGAENVITVTIGDTTYATGNTKTPSAPSAPTAPTQRLAAAPRTDWRVIVSPDGSYYTVRIYYGTKEVVNPGQKMTARMNFTLPDGWDADAIFAVFRNADGSLTSFKAAYDPVAGTLTFHTDCTGTFALVSFPFEGKLYSADFYTALGELESIRDLPVRR